MFEGFVFWILCAVVAAMIGHNKGRGGDGFLLGIFLGPFGILVAWLMKGNRKACPYCRELMAQDAIVCPHCQRHLLGELESQLQELAKRKCPYCAELVKKEAIVCRFCGRDLPPEIDDFSDDALPKDSDKAEALPEADLEETKRKGPHSASSTSSFHKFLFIVFSLFVLLTPIYIWFYSSNLGTSKEPATKSTRNVDVPRKLELNKASVKAEVPNTNESNLKVLKENADRGDAMAQLELGKTYYFALLGTEQDYVEALNWFREAADQGNAAAQRYIGWAFHDGHGVPKDMKEARKWFRKAADQGDENAKKMIKELRGKGF